MKRYHDEMELLEQQNPLAPKQKLSYDDDYDEAMQEEDLLETESAWELGFERGERMASEEFLGGADDY